MLSISIHLVWLFAFHVTFFVRANPWEFLLLMSRFVIRNWTCSTVVQVKTAWGGGVQALNGGGGQGREVKQVRKGHFKQERNTIHITVQKSLIADKKIIKQDCGVILISSKNREQYLFQVLIGSNIYFWTFSEAFHEMSWFESLASSMTMHLILHQTDFVLKLC